MEGRVSLYDTFMIMFEFQSNIKRQIEILGICLSAADEKEIRISDLAELFGVEDLTIKRDLNHIRSFGIDIHSHRKDGIRISSVMDKKKLKELILYFVGLCYTEQSLDRSTYMLVENLGTKALENIVMLQLCIDKSYVARINYWNETNTEFNQREIMPLLVFQNEGSWRVLVQHDNKIKQFLFEKIRDVKQTNKKFKRIPRESFDDLFTYSWKSWISADRFSIKLLISKNWVEKIKPRMLIGNQKITETGDGSIIFEATVNSLNEVAGWIVSRGEGIKVLHPEELKHRVINLARGALENYNSQE